MAGNQLRAVPNMVGHDLFQAFWNIQLELLQPGMGKCKKYYGAHVRYINEHIFHRLGNFWIIFHFIDSKLYRRFFLFWFLRHDLSRLEVQHGSSCVVDR